MGHINPGRIKRPDEQPQSSVTSYDPSILFNQETAAPIEPTAPANNPAPQQPTSEQKPLTEPTPPEAPPEKAVPTSKSVKTKAEKPAKKAAASEEDDDVAGKDKYSIYLPPKLSMALRMVYIVTRKKFSHITELALTDMLFRRYQCHNPDCLARFSISEKDVTPRCCPVCGKRDFHPYRLDVLD